MRRKENGKKENMAVPTILTAYILPLTTTAAANYKKKTEKHIYIFSDYAHSLLNLKFTSQPFIRLVDKG